jgi:hypothetical protein
MERGAGIDEKAVDEAMDLLSSELAARFGALSDTFGEWRKPETARAVLESFLAGDRDGFHELLPAGFDGPGPDPLEPPDTWIPKGPKFCIFVAEVVEKLVPLRRVPCTRVRTDLSAAEKARACATAVSRRSSPSSFLSANAAESSYQRVNFSIAWRPRVSSRTARVSSAAE